MARFLHVTDLHVSPPGAPNRQTDTVATLERMVEIARALAPDFVVASGDLTDRGDVESYRILAQRMAVLEMPVIYALGNHDDRAAFRAAFPDQPGAADAPLDHDRMVAGVHVVVLDSSVPRQTSGGLEEAQLAFLSEALGRHPDARKLLVVHHPPAGEDPGRSPWAQIDAEGSARLAEAIRGHDVAAILSGHIHFSRLRMWNGIPVLTAVGQQSTVDPTHPTGLAGGLQIVEGTAFGLCTLSAAEFQATFVPVWPGPEIKSIAPEVLDSLR